MNLKDKLKKIDVPSAKQFVDEKVPVNEVAPVKVTESEMRLANISKLSAEIYDADIGAKSKGLQKANLFVSEKTDAALKRAILVQEHEKKHNRDVVVVQRAVEHCFLIGEELKHLAFMGDKDAIKILEKIKAAGVEDFRIYKRQ
ncbi:hypothetical protein [Pseudomonas sp. HY7a-MNA-CIBAN-0227]|uniref:hypothetical protein n=1 Tax=Pseudomonas sp. HY7a-MNA-CIBAN-0227 TaxID=3140474 RepID=UPI00332052D8